MGTDGRRRFSSWWVGHPEGGASLLCGYPFCGEGPWLCHAVDILLAQKYREVWLMLADSRVSGKFFFSVRDTLYPSGTSPFSLWPMLTE